ncbi:14283_t:CDS:2, partial [Gigaspora margarita]
SSDIVVKVLKNKNARVNKKEDKETWKNGLHKSSSNDEFNNIDEVDVINFSLLLYNKLVHVLETFSSHLVRINSENSPEISDLEVDVTERYPTIDFNNLPARIQGFKNALLEILNNVEISYYRKLAMDLIRDIGVARSRSNLKQFNTFYEIMPGYYGAKGLLIISETLQNMFMNIIGKACKPQTPNRFLFEVLVPETAIQLIMEDYGPNCTYDDAQKIMNQSVDYGMIMYPINDEN